MQCFLLTCRRTVRGLFSADKVAIARHLNFYLASSVTVLMGVIDEVAENNTQHIPICLEN